MGITASNLQELGLIDEIIDEPLGAAHRDYDKTAEMLKKSLVLTVKELKAKTIDDLISNRQDRIRQYGCFNN
jgi:acetyl-CoA carboxylase carboxyl transferase subunit alpha